MVTCEYIIFWQIILKKNPIFVEKDLENGDSESGVEPDHKIFTVYASEEVR